MVDAARITLRIDDGPTVDAAREATVLSRQLIRDGVRVEAASDESGPVLAKSGLVITAGSIIISGALSVQVVRSITRVVLAAVRRGLAGKVQLEDGERRIDIENASRETERALVAWLVASRAPGDEDAR